MSQPNHCPDCGAELPTGDTEGLCPKCLIGVGLEGQNEVAKPAGNALTENAEPKRGGFVPPEPSELAPHFPQLEISELLGHGGMGVVYKAKQTKLDRYVALKIVKPESASDPAFAERFNREARTLARLNHPHIVAVHDFGEAGGLYYFIMEYVDGTDLRQLLEGQRLQPEQAFAVIPQICEALQFAHDEGIVHRDIKPANILLDKTGRVKIADFGLAKLKDGTADDFTLTGTHQVIGTPRYMAPEQMEGSHQVDHRADIYSLGVVFYEMLTGELPLGRFDPPSKKAHVNAQLDDVVLKTLAREPGRRYQQAGQIKADIESLSESGRPVVADHRAADQVKDAPPRAPVDYEDARRHVQGPAIGLIIAGILNLLPLPSIVLGFLFWDLDGQATAGFPTVVTVFIPLLACLLSFLLGVVMIIGGLKMRKLEKNGLALTLTASILAMLPFSAGCVVGFPVGIWSLIVLNRPIVRAGFMSKRNEWSEPPLPKNPGVAPYDALLPTDRFQIERMVRGPATGLMFVGLLNLVFHGLAVLVMPRILAQATPAVTTWPIVLERMQFLCPMLVGLPLTGLLILGGLKMRQLEHYWLAVMGSLVAMMPCNVLFIFGLPVGLWSLAVLSHSDVKTAFRGSTVPPM